MRQRKSAPALFIALLGCAQQTHVAIAVESEVQWLKPRQYMLVSDDGCTLTIDPIVLKHLHLPQPITSRWWSCP